MGEEIKIESFKLFTKDGQEVMDITEGVRLSTIPDDIKSIPFEDKELTFTADIKLTKKEFEGLFNCKIKWWQWLLIKSYYLRRRFIK